MINKTQPLTREEASEFERLKLIKKFLALAEQKLH